MWRKSEVSPRYLNGDVTAVQDGSMKTLFAKILLAQVVTAVIALLVVMVMTRSMVEMVMTI
jgi:hypothetical protein